MRKYVTEAIGTFFLVLTIGATVIEPGAGELAPLAIGAVLMAMIFAGAYAVGGISGGAFNPAVAVGISTMGLVNWSTIWVYLLANFAGAALAAYAYKAIHPALEQPITARAESQSEGNRTLTDTTAG
jgi:aquaporin Z